MKRKFFIGLLLAFLIFLFWSDWEQGKEIAAFHAEAGAARKQLADDLDRVKNQQQQLVGALIELIRRTGHTNMLSPPPSAQ